MALKIVSKFPVTFNIDGEPVKAFVKRLSPEESVSFLVQFRMLAEGDSSLSQLDFELKAMKFTMESISSYVELEPDQIFIDNKMVVTGEEFAHSFCSRQEVLMAVMSAIAMENRLGAKEKERIAQLKLEPAERVVDATVTEEQPVGV